MSRVRCAVVVLVAVLLAGCFRSSPRDATDVAADDPLPGVEAEALPPAADLVEEPVTEDMKQALDNPSDAHRELYVKLTKNADLETRLAALEALEETDLDEASTAAILARTSDHEASVRRQAIELIWYFDIVTHEALEAIERLITDVNPDVRAEAIETVTYLEMEDGGKRMISALTKVIAAGGESSYAAIEALKEIGPPPEAAPVLKAAFEEHGEAALYALARIEEPQTDMVPWLREIMTSDGDYDRRLAAAWTLGRFGDTEPLIAAAGSSDAARREVGIEGLGGVRSPSDEVVNLLIAGLNDKEPAIRECAADAIGYAESPSDALLVALMRSFADPNTDVRDMARMSLDQLIDEERLEAEAALKTAEAALAESPEDKGLILAKAKLIYPLAYDLTAYGDDDAKAVELFNSAAAGLLQVVLPSDYQLSADEKEEIGTLFYDAACAATQAGNPDLGMKYLKAALENGWNDIDWLKEDSDLDPLREREDYRELMGKYGG